MSKQPTIFQGDGGFGGKKVLPELKKALFGWWNGSARKDGLSFEHIDTDPALAEAFGPGEFYHLNDVPLREMLSLMRADRKAFPDLRQRLGDLDKLNQALGTDIINQGAQRCRPIALSSLAFHLEQERQKLLGFLTEPIREIFAFPKTSFSGGEKRKLCSVPLSVWTIGSLCGGQNSGTFIDLSYLNHYLLRLWGVRQYQLFAVLALPDVFWQVEQGGLRANTAAALKELAHHYATLGLPPLQHGKTLKLPRTNPPFAMVYLVSGTNACGRTFNQQEQVAQVVAQALRMMTEGRMAEHYRALLQNVLRELRYPYLASSFGCYVIEFPAQELQILFGYRLSQRLVRDYLLREAGDKEKKAKSDLAGFLHEARLTAGPGVFLRRDREGRPIAVRLAPFKRLKGKLLQRALAAYHSEQLLRWEKALDEIVERTSQSLSSTLEQWVLTLVNEPVGGLRQAESSLEGLAAWVEKVTEQLRKRTKEVEEERARFRARQARRRFALPLFRDRRLLKQKERELALALLSLKLSAQDRLLARLGEKVTAMTSEAQGWADTLGALEAEFKRRAEDFGRERVAQRPVVLESALSPQEEEELYQEGIENALALSSQGLTFRQEAGELILVYRTGQARTEAGRWLILSEEGYGRHLEYTKSFWKHLKEISLEEVLGKRGLHLEELVDYLEDRAAPLIVLDRLKQGQAVTVRKVLGTEKGATGLFQALPGRASLSLVETGDRQRIEMLVTWHGISPFALIQSEDLELSYQALYPVEPLHVFPERELMDDEGEKIFYRLLGHNRIRPLNGDFYTLDLDSKRGIQLEAENIKELISLFSLREDLVEQAKGFLHRLELALEPEEAAAMLRENARSLSLPGFPKLEKKAKKEIRCYATRLRRRSERRVMT